MAERLTASLEDGTLVRLRELAGGERKVGAYLSQLVAWLWPYKEDIDAVGLSGCVLLRADGLHTDIEATRGRIYAIDARLDVLETSFRELHELQDTIQRLLATQEGGGQNDA